MVISAAVINNGSLAHIGTASQQAVLLTSQAPRSLTARVQDTTAVAVVGWPDIPVRPARAANTSADPDSV